MEKSKETNSISSNIIDLERLQSGEPRQDNRGVRLPIPGNTILPSNYKNVTDFQLL